MEETIKGDIKFEGVASRDEAIRRADAMIPDGAELRMMTLYGLGGGWACHVIWRMRLPDTDTPARHEPTAVV